MPAELAVATGANTRVKRRANELMRHVAEDDIVDCLPYFCECDDPDCTRAVWLDCAAYDEIRRTGTPLLSGPHHAYSMSATSL